LPVWSRAIKWASSIPSAICRNPGHLIGSAASKLGFLTPREPFKTWAEDFVKLCCPGGESFQELFTRTAAFWEELSQQHADLALVVTHGCLIRALLAHVLPIPFEHAMRINMDYGGVSKIHLNEYGPIVHYINR